MGVRVGGRVRVSVRVRVSGRPHWLMTIRRLMTTRRLMTIRRLMTTRRLMTPVPGRLAMGFLQLGLGLAWLGGVLKDAACRVVMSVSRDGVAIPLSLRSKMGPTCWSISCLVLYPI